MVVAAEFAVVVETKFEVAIGSKFKLVVDLELDFVNSSRISRYQMKAISSGNRHWALMIAAWTSSRSTVLIWDVDDSVS